MRTAQSIKERDRLEEEIQRKRTEETQRQRALLDSLATQNIELKHTMEMMKMNVQPKAFIKENVSLKKELKVKQEECRALEDKLTKASLDLQVYSAVEEQLDKLESLQYRLMNQNSKMKETLQNISKIVCEKPSNLQALMQHIITEYQEYQNIIE